MRSGGARIRLTVVLTHPVQYYAPWFRYIAGSCRELELRVLYATEPTSAQQGTGFGTPFSWDVPLRTGYDNRVVRGSRDTGSVHSSELFGLDVPEIVPAILESDPDVVLVPGWHSVTLLRAIVACRRRGIPMLYRGDSNLLSAPSGWRRTLWGLKTRLMLRQYAACLYVGRRAHEYLRAFGVPERKLAFSPHCVDNDFFARQRSRAERAESREESRRRMGIRPDAFVVAFIGKLESTKRLGDAIAAVAMLGGDVQLVVVGDGAERSSLEKQARRLGVTVAWCGFLNQSRMGAVHAVADCLLLPSTGQETWGLVVNEALAAGVPCIVSDHVGCAPDLIQPGRTGDVFAMGDTAGLAAAIARVRSALASNAITAQACRDRAESYSFEHATRGMLEACRELMGTRA